MAKSVKRISPAVVILILSVTLAVCGERPAASHAAGAARHAKRIGFEGVGLC